MIIAWFLWGALVTSLIGVGAMVGAGVTWDRLIDVRFWLGLFVLPLIPALILVSIVAWLVAVVLAGLAISEGVGLL